MGRAWGGGGGVRVGSEGESGGHAPPGKFLKKLDCRELHFARFHGGEREKESLG